jgi:predicted N-acyltransferase
MPRLQTFDRIAALPAADWDALLDGDDPAGADAQPFVRHAFLDGLERHGCLQPQWGWTPRHAALFDGDRLVAAAPAYLKTNSHGEFVFDHAWAQAYARLGRDYFPKWLVAVPYSPVTGPRVLARDDGARRALLAAMTTHAAAAGLPSVHANFLRADEDAAFDRRWLARTDVQFHWRNRGWRDFAAFLDALEARKRKNIRQERARVARAGVRFRVLHGDEATPAQLDAVHGFYVDTQLQYGNHPALSAAFFRHLAATMPRQVVLVLAELDGDTIAGAFCLRSRDTLYGRYWGASVALPGLHFETCYYQGIEYCLREGLARFEPGAQGEHKVARGFRPELTRSRHWLADADIADALAPWCAQERAATLRYRDRVLDHSPFREPAADPAPGG